MSILANRLCPPRFSALQPSHHNDFQDAIRIYAVCCKTAKAGVLQEILRAVSIARRLARRSDEATPNRARFASA
jgi:hypothetical protein